MRRIGYWALILWGVAAFHIPQMWLMFFFLFPKPGRGGLEDALFNALLFAGWAGVHSLLARDFARRFLSRIVAEDMVKLVYVSFAGITQCLMLHFWRPLEGGVWRAQGVWWWILAALFLVSMTAVFVSSLLLDYMEALGVRAVIRRMRKDSSQPMPLSLRGPYAYCRHPVYLFTLVLLWIGPVMNFTKLEFSLLAALYVLLGTFLEDRDTARRMGPAYREYSENVPMLIPRLTPWRPERGRSA